MTITFYDIPSRLDGNAWSPNTFKARISLNYKGIPYNTEWIEYPDIEATLKRIGGAPTSKKPDGRDHYTLPAIYDSTTGRVVTDSIEIATYLDDTYPDKPALFPFNTCAAIAMFDHVFDQRRSIIFPIMLPAVHDILNPTSQEYFRRTREDMFQKKLEEFATSGPACDEIWRKVRENYLEHIAGLYDKNGVDKPFFLGNTFSFADAIVIGNLLWVKVVFGPDSDEWRAVASWCGGRWKKLLELTKKWQT